MAACDDEDDAERDAIAFLRACLHAQYGDGDYLLDHATVRRHRDITRYLAGAAVQFATEYARQLVPGISDDQARAWVDAHLTAALRAS